MSPPERNMAYTSFVLLLDYLRLSYVAAAVVLYCFIVIGYRLTFHPLAGFPGPKLAASSLLYEYYYDGICWGRFWVKLQELHKQYGTATRSSTACSYPSTDTAQDRLSQSTQTSCISTTPNTIPPCLGMLIWRKTHECIDPWVSISISKAHSIGWSTRGDGPRLQDFSPRDVSSK